MNPGDHPLARHRARAAEVVTNADPDAIRAMYQELGRDFWDRVASGDADDVPVLSAPETLDEVLRALDGVSGLILDAGCGPNPAAAIALASRSATTVVALDIGWGMVRTALAVSARSDARLLGVVGDVERLPFRRRAFDALLCDDTVEHLPDDAAGVSELARVLRRGARAVLATPNRHSVAVLAARAQDRWAGRVRTDRDYFVASSHLREYTWPEFERLVSSSFRLIRRHSIGWRQGRGKRAVTRLLGLPRAYRLSQMIALECEPR